MDKVTAVSSDRVPPPSKVACTGMVTVALSSLMGAVVTRSEMPVGSWSSSSMTTSAGRAVMVPGTVPVTSRVSLPSAILSSNTVSVIAAVADISPAGMVRMAVEAW